MPNALNFNRSRLANRFTAGALLGNVYFAQSTNSFADASGGYGPDYPASTVAAAQTLCTAANGDTVYIGAGHAESIVGAAGITFSKSGVNYIGQGLGRARPTFTFSTSTAAQIIVSGANVKFENIVFDFTGIDAIVAAISVTGADVWFDNCEFITNSATAGCVLGILTAATADRLKITNCRFLGSAANSGTTTTAQIQHESGADYLIQNCYFAGKCTQNVLNTTNQVLRGLIDSNRFVTTGTVAVSVKSTSTPFITNNRINVASGTSPIVAAAGFVAGNVYSAAAGVTAGTAATI